MMKRKPRAYSREKRKEQIIGQFTIWYSKGDTDPKTMYRIARALDMIPGQKVTDMLLELVDEGKLAFEWREKSGRWTARAFSLVGGADIITSKVTRRVIVKRRGVVSGQLELAL
jgi:hypothetical protein